MTVKVADDTAVSVTDLGKHYQLGKKNSHVSLGDRVRGIGARFRGASVEPTDDAIWALDHISFDVKKGERLAVIGRNGAGKSTLLKIMSRVVHPSTGEVRIKGRLASLLEVGTGFNDNLSGRENVYLNASLYGLDREEIRARFDDIVAFSEVERFIDTPVKAYSSGMRMRLAFAVAAHLEPEILLMDEVLAVGDMSFQQKCLERVEGMTQGGRTLFFVSHSMDAVMRYCDRCIWLHNGKIRHDGPSEEVVAAYVEAVLGAKSSIDGSRRTAAVSSVTSAAIGPAELGASQGGAPVPASTVLAQESADPAALKKDVSPSDGAGGDSLPTSPVNSSGPVGNSSDVAAVLESGMLTGANGEEKAVFRVDEAVRIEFGYRVNQPGLFMPAVHVICPQGTLAFVSCPPSTDTAPFVCRGGEVMRATIEIPAHLLNIGTYRVTLVVFDPVLSPMKRHFIAENALSFHSVEAKPGQNSARGIMPRGFPGPVRPLLGWTVDREETVAAAGLAS